MSRTIDELRAELAEAEAEAAVERAAAEAEAAAERARLAEHRAERGRAWGSAHLKAGNAERVAQVNRVRAAEASLLDALKAEPWVLALVELQAARQAADMVDERHNLAREFVDLPPLTPRAVDGSVTMWQDGSPSPEFLVRPVVRVVDALADETTELERESLRVDLEALLAGTDPLPEPEEVTADPSRVEVVNLTAADGTHVVATRHLDNGFTEYHREDGTPYLPPDDDGGDVMTI